MWTVMPVAGEISAGCGTVARPGLMKALEISP
jgi:hypothetical protein